jgi:hypothetical protein
MYPLELWQQLYQSAVFELDDVKIRGCILQARQAIHDRLEDSVHGRIRLNGDERIKIEDALVALRMLERQADTRAAAPDRNPAA